ncbi:hypothetical protein [Pararhizobium sp. O133]|uniref:hypothetical protein n=1 Tax=Pararhizobium sp. O133 TaxID=3449278 RepID=UPI003F6881D9
MLRFVAPFLLACLVAVVITLFVRSDLLPYNAAVAAFLLMTAAFHGVALMVRKVRRKFFGPLDREWVGTIPNLSILLIAVNYGLGLFLIRDAGPLPQISYGLTGVLVLAVISIAHLTSDMLAKPARSRNYAIPYPEPLAESLTAKARGAIYYLRLACVVTSIGLFVLIVLVGYGVELAAAAFLLNAVYVYVFYKLRALFRSERLRREAGLQQAGKAYFEHFQPVLMLYYSDPVAKDSKEVYAWIQRLSALEQPFVTMVRERAHFIRLVKLGVTDIVLADTMDTIEQFVFKSLKAVVTINNNAKNTQIVRFGNLKQINFVPSKPYENIRFPNSFGMYSDLFFFSHKIAQKAVDAGVLASIAVIEPDNATVLPALAGPLDDNGLTIGYVLGAPYRDWSLAARPSKAIVQRLQKRAKPTTLLIRANAVAKSDQNSASTFAEIGASIRQFAPTADNRTTFFTASAMSAKALTNQADILLCDLSQVDGDLLAVNKPIIVTDIFGLARSPATASAFLTACYVLNPDFSNFEAILEDITDTDSLLPKRQALISTMTSTVKITSFKSAMDAALAPGRNE